MMDRTVAILIPVFNAAATLEATLQSAFAQTYEDVEIIALDDGSTDGSGAILAAHSDRITVVHQENRGGSAARNRLLTMSSAPFIQYLDADDLIDPGKITEQVAYLEAHSDVAVVTDTMRLFYDDSAEDSSLFAPVNNDWWADLIDVSIPFTSSALWRREAVEAVGAWNEALPSGQEYDLYFRLLKADRRIAHYDLAMTRYRMPSHFAPPKRDPSRTIALRLAFLDQIEAHLSETKAMNSVRSQALAGERLQLARKLWKIDRPRALRLARRLHRREIARLSPTAGLPRRYLAAASVLGFVAAERLASLVR